MARMLFATTFLVFVGLSLGQRRNTPSPPKREPVPDVPQQCLDCICYGSSGCDPTARCHNAGADAYFCGPYVISWAYWHDGGRPGDKGRAHDFETCLNNKTCAEQAVRGYMQKHAWDCDQDGSISCYDFARVHKLGPGACNSNNIESSEYWGKFLDCYEGGGQGGGQNGGQSGGQGGRDPYGGYDYGDGSVDARRGGQPNVA